MQHIDENTFIDDTLVTCAEYQLFIDEMRELGKYYQPDHWASYQFPVGQARELILGMRHSDAVAFCEWLTSREGGEWKFRLPNQEEVNAFPMKSLGESPLGYWCDSYDHFIWIASVPKSEGDLTLALRRAFTLILDQCGHIYLNRDHAIIIERDRELAYARVHARVHALNLDHALDLDHARPFDVNRIHDLDRTFALDRAFALNRDLDRDRTRALDIAIDGTLDLVTSGDYYQYDYFARNGARALATYIDLFILRERIAGHSPAFEGIRLVKERIK